VGPNRIYVKLARQLAAKGYIVLRFDLSGIGDSDYRTDKLPADKSILEEVRQAMDLLRETRGIEHFILAGICSGASISLKAATLDERIIGAVVINPAIPGDQLGNEMNSSTYYWKRALFSPQSWLKFLFGKSSYGAVYNAIHFKIKKTFSPNSITNEESPEVFKELKESFQSLKVRNVRLLLLFSEVEIGLDYFNSLIGDELSEMARFDLLRIEKMSGADHLITPLDCQKTLIETILEWIPRASYPFEGRIDTHSDLQ
jgi:pimeloyl-ACP methyl ester carboxylesterase